MCEKPIAVDVMTTSEVLAKAKSKPELTFLVPFCRRCAFLPPIHIPSKPSSDQL